MRSPIRNGEDNPYRPRHFRPSADGPGDADHPLTRALELSRIRLVKAGAVFVIAFLVISLRLVDVTILETNESHLNPLAVAKPLEYSRADIVDRNGQVLATTLRTESLFADAKEITDPAGTAAALARFLPDTSEAELAGRLKSGKGFIWLHRHLTPDVVDAVNELGIPGLDFQPEEQRVYPQGSLTAHVVGYSDLDNHGLAGIERSFDAALAQHQEPLQLSLDVRLQAIVKEEVQKAIDDFSAIGGTGMIMNCRTGEILAMVSLPDFDPNDMSAIVPATIFNRATLGVYEMGSVFKIFNTALALQNKKATLDSFFDTVHPIHIGRFTIHDYEPQSHPITVAQIFMLSSNIGSAKMALESGGAAQEAFLGSLGLLRPAAIELPEVAAPHYPNPWRDINTMTVAFGHGISVSPLQTLVAANAIVNHGILIPATLVKRADGYQPAGTRVISEETSFQLRRLLRLVVTDGTGKNADVPGYLVGGKTGTAEKVSGHGYAKKTLLSSFIGVYPINDPEYITLVSIDEPHGTKKSFGFATAGWTAAPATARIIARMAPLLDQMPITETAEIHNAYTVDFPGKGKKIAAD